MKSAAKEKTRRLMVIDIPLGEALVAVEMPRYKVICENCALYQYDIDCNCGGFKRKDGKNVIYELVDLEREKIIECAEKIEGIAGDNSYLSIKGELEEISSTLRGIAG